MPLPNRIRSNPVERASRILRQAASHRVAAAAVTIAVLGFGGCAQSPQQLADGRHPKEYFPSSVYGPASRRVIADGQPIPHGGGQYLVGKPYTIAGQTYYPSERKITQVGLASWYGDAFHGRLTANGEVYDRDGFTAAHPTMPLPSYARVTNLRNNYSMIVRVNDRGPYHSNRVMDVSRRVAEALDFERGGTGKVKVEYVGRASLAGSDDAKLYATLRTNGPARLEGVEAPSMVAEAAPRPARVASLAPYTPEPMPPARRVVEEHRPEALEAYREHRPSPTRSAHIDETARLRLPSTGPEHVTPSVSRHTAGQREAIIAVKHDATIAIGRHEDRLIRVASRGETMRAPSVREAMPMPRPGKTAMGEAKHLPVKSPVAHGAPVAARAVVLPPTRPAHVVATASHGVIRHAAAGLRLTRSRDD